MCSSDLWRKPLFSPDRKPAPRMASDGAGLGDLELTGIILTPTLRMALLRDKNGDHREVRLREGQSIHAVVSAEMVVVGTCDASRCSSDSRKVRRITKDDLIDT